MFFASDNTGPVPPQVLEALGAANAGYQSGYGADSINQAVQAKIRDIFEAPEAAVYLVATGTAANSLALATLANPWDTVFCSPVAHIHEDECNAPEFYMGGAKLTLVGDSDKITPDQLRAAIEAEQTRGVHGPQRGPVSITQVTEQGRVYTLDEISALCDVSRSFELPVHMDGARFTNAMVSLDCSAAEMTWKAGVDVVSFGGTKNGLMGVEAVILFDPKLAWEFELRRKRGGHLFSKHRYLSAQMLAYLTDGLWLDLAGKANAAAKKLSNGILSLEGATLVHPTDANAVFASWNRASHRRAMEAGAKYYFWGSEGNLDGPDEGLESARLVCSWCTADAEIEQFLALIG